MNVVLRATFFNGFRRWVRPPAFLLALATAVATVGIGMTIVGSQTTGVSTDEPGHVRRLNAYLHTGLYVREFEVEQTPPGDIPTGAYIYGPVTSLLQHHANRLLGNEPEYEARTRAYHYEVRHAVIGAMAIAGLLVAMAFALIWLSAALGLKSKSVESSSNVGLPLILLPFFGNGFVPTDSMPTVLRWFAEYQPFTPFIDALRGLLMGTPIGNSGYIALGWCVVIGFGSYLWSKKLFNRESTR